MVCPSNQGETDFFSAEKCTKFLRRHALSSGVAASCSCICDGTSPRCARRCLQFTLPPQSCAAAPSFSRGRRSVRASPPGRSPGSEGGGLRRRAGPPTRRIRRDGLSSSRGCRRPRRCRLWDRPTSVQLPQPGRTQISQTWIRSMTAPILSLITSSAPVSLPVEDLLMRTRCFPRK